MPDSNSNLSTVDGQQAVDAAKSKEDDTAAAQATAATTHREQETLVAVVAATRKTLDEAWALERAATLAWEKEKTIITHHLEQQLAAAQGIAIPRMTTIAPSTLAPTPMPPPPRTCMGRLPASRTCH
jgi:hypothetical protein